MSEVNSIKSRLRRGFFALLAAISFLVFPIFVLVTPTNGPFPGSMQWDVQAQQWLPSPPETHYDWIKRLTVTVALDVISAIVVGIWMKQFIASQRARDREWRGLCRVCSFDLRRSPTTCPECGTSIPLPFKGDQRKPGQSIPPGRQAMILLFLTVPILAILIYFFLFVLIITIWPPVI